MADSLSHDLATLSSQRPGLVHVCYTCVCMRAHVPLTTVVAAVNWKLSKIELTCGGVQPFNRKKNATFQFPRKFLSEKNINNDRYLCWTWRKDVLGHKCFLTIGWFSTNRTWRFSRVPNVLRSIPDRYSWRRTEARWRIARTCCWSQNCHEKANNGHALATTGCIFPLQWSVSFSKCSEACQWKKSMKHNSNLTRYIG